ncbi:MAG: tRNA (adenosine(37)-N6)-dimethylallyltransferase MiaA [Rickettsiales bacterium]|jgi:tRNA dimethylallyltransferase|nr:tRNA (adenosine(37)-N6)-dimethylallyltransferase MiaA [Rickettsiales bacterium]
MVDRRVLVIAGPTASGKSSLALDLARNGRGVVINADSVQLHYGMPVLSAQPSVWDRKVATHRLYGIFSPYENANLFKWLVLVLEEIRKALELEKLAIVVGGTGLYLSRLLDGLRPDLPESSPDIRNELNTLYDNIGWDRFLEIVRKVDPEGAAKTSPHNRQRLLRVYEVYRMSGKKIGELEQQPNRPILNRGEVFLINVLPPREMLYARCDLRFRSIANRTLEEVRCFLEKYPSPSDYSASTERTIGFREIRNYFQGKLKYEEMIELVLKNTRNFAKRQYTWFRNQFATVDYTLKDILDEESRKSIADDIIGRL